MICVGTMYFSGKSQCDKNFQFESSKTEYQDAQGNVQRSIDEHAVIKVTGKEITITPESDHKMVAYIKSSTCNWKVPYKEGKLTLNAVYMEKDVEKKTVLVFEGKDNKVSMSMTFEAEPGKVIKVWADKFEEIKLP